jgi:hypothetical protein
MPEVDTASADAIKLQATVVQLSGLLEAYTQLFESAKQQLEQLDVSEDQLRRIERNAVQQFDYSKVAGVLANRITDLECFQPDSDVAQANKRLINAVADRVSDSIAAVSLNAMNDKIHAAVASIRNDCLQAIREQVDSRFRGLEAAANNEAREQFRRLKYGMRNLMLDLYDREEISQMAADAQASMQSTQPTEA